jgi:hypothetical protein
MSKKVKREKNVGWITLLGVIFGGGIGYLAFNVFWAMVFGILVGAFFHWIKKIDIQEESEKSNLPEKEDELDRMAKRKDPNKKEISIKTFVKRDKGGWYERTATYKD